VLKSKKVPQQGIYLTEEEMKRIENYYDALMKKKRHQPEKDCLTLFLIESYTGARFSDCENFTINNLKEGRLTYTSIKTSILTEVPEHRRLQELINRMPSVHYANSTVNRVLKRVAKKVGIVEPVTIFTKGKLQTRPKYEFVSTHVGRKSFVTNLANRGVDIYTISAYAGHSSAMQTDHYIVRDTIKTPEEALSFFND
jgi:integrase